MSLEHSALLTLLSVLAGCGARTSLVGDESTDAGAGGSAQSSQGSGSAGTDTSSTGQGGAPDSASTTGAGAGDCEARDLDRDGGGAVVLRTDGEIAYFTTADGRIVRGDLDTGEERVLASGLEGLGDLAIFDGDLYFSDERAIARIPLAGGDATPLVEISSTAFSIAVDESGLYWIDGPGTLSSHAIERMRPDGSRVTLASNVQLPLGLSVGPAGVVFTDKYDLTAPAGTVRGVDVEGSAPTLIASSRPSPEIPFQRDGFIFWVETSDEAITNRGGIVRAAPDGSGLEKVLTLDRRYPVWATSSGSHYFMTVLDEQLETELLAATYPVAGAQTVVASAGPESFFTMVATTPKRLVWTVQLGRPDAGPVDGVRSLCLGATALP